MKTGRQFAAVALGTAIALTMSALGTKAQTIKMPSQFVPGDAAAAAAAKDQNSPFLCQGGSTVLAVWSDNRANSTGGYEGETSWDIYGMRFDASGNPLETVPFAIAAGPAAQKSPRASWNGTNWIAEPSRRINKCADTRRSAIVSKCGCALGSSLFVNSSTIAFPP